MHACESAVALGGILDGDEDAPGREPSIWMRNACSSSGRVARITH